MKILKTENLLIICSILGILGVALGAFGAHGLKKLLPIEKLDTYSTGITYHFYHTIVLLFIVIMMKMTSSKWLYRSAFCFILGIILFSGSLYLLATREVIGLSNYRWLGPLTPIGGMFFILGWGCLGLSAYNKNVKHAAK